MLRLQRALPALLCLVLTSGLAVVAAASPASATSTILCRGYDGCARLNMSSAGYKAAAGTMYWRMYTGHNCTNYAAYRMVRSGMPNVRPWSGGGNATYWGTSNSSITDSVPAVGAIAWWAANVRPAGSSGHVAYVERVVSPDEIIVSQDSWGGDFSWARITRAGGGWPSGFVHFNDVPLENTAAPAVNGTVKVGAELAASPGTWSQPDPTYSYQWFANRRAIAGAVEPTLSLRRGHEGKRISVRVTASKVGFPSTVVTSEKTSAVEPGRISNLSGPVVTGEPRVDGTLTATPGAWSPEPASLAYQWLANGKPVAGATTDTLVPGPAEVGRTLSLRVTASRNGYDDVAVASAKTVPVAPGTITVTRGPVVRGTQRPGQTLTLDPGTHAPAGAAVSVTWLRGGVPVADATGTSYRLTMQDLGARVSARVELTKPGYTPVNARTPRVRRVKVAPTMTVTATPATERLQLRVDVSADGVDPVGGRVRLKSGGEVLGELTLRRGTAAVTLRDLASGRMPVKVRFLRTRTVTPVTDRQVVRIG